MLSPLYHRTHGLFSATNSPLSTPCRVFSRGRDLLKDLWKEQKRPRLRAFPSTPALAGPLQCRPTHPKARRDANSRDSCGCLCETRATAIGLGAPSTHSHRQQRPPGAASLPASFVRFLLEQCVLFTWQLGQTPQPLRSLSLPVPANELIFYEERQLTSRSSIAHLNQ